MAIGIPADYSAVDPVSGAVFCRRCDDIIFSDHFERLHKLALARVEEAHDTSREISIIGKGRDRGEFKPWTAPPEGLALDTVKNPCRGESIRQPAYGLPSRHQVSVLFSTCPRRVSYRPFFRPSFTTLCCERTSCPTSTIAMSAPTAHGTWEPGSRIWVRTGQSRQIATKAACVASLIEHSRR